MSSVRERFTTLFQIPAVLLLLFLNCSVFAVELSHLTSIDSFFYQYGVVAARWRLESLREWVELPQLLFTLISAQFVHSSWTHLIFNLAFLAGFGPAIERRVGTIRFLVLFLLSGMGAIGVHVVIQPATTIPLVGASGAVAGILGAYLLLFPHAKLELRLFKGQKRFGPVPAFVFLGVWFLFTWLQGIASIGDAVRPGQGALWVHITGFVLGMVGAILVHPSDAPHD